VLFRSDGLDALQRSCDDTTKFLRADTIALVEKWHFDKGRAPGFVQILNTPRGQPGPMTTATA
jgi:hypothetical protein